MTMFSDPRENKHNPGAYGIVIWHGHITKICRKRSTYSPSCTKMSLQRNILLTWLISEQCFSTLKKRRYKQ